jgi:hypothetical protein
MHPDLRAARPWCAESASRPCHLPPATCEEPIDRRGFLRLVGIAALGGAIEGCTRPLAQTAPLNAAANSTSTAPVAGPGSSPATSAVGALSEDPPVATADLDKLARVLSGRLLRPGDAGYLPAAQLYSTRFDNVRPTAVARCASVADVQKCLEFARATGIPVAARSGGHSYAGYSTTSGLVIDVRPMSAVGRGSTPGSARIGAGATLLDAYAGLAATGSAIPGGSCPTVGIAGSTLGGGVGVVARKYGLSCDALTAVELVLPDGVAIRCDERREPDLFWANRGGGGGNFGIVTALEFRTHPVRELTRFLVRWDWSHAHAVVSAWQQWLTTLPDELWSSLHLDGAPSASATPKVYASGVYVGEQARLQPLLDELQAATKAPMTTRFVKSAPYLETMLIEGGCATVSACHLPSDDPAGNLGRDTNAARSDFIARPLSGTGVDIVLDAVESRRVLGLPGGGVLFDAYGGAINTIGASETAFVHRDTVACLQYVATWKPDAATAVVNANQSWLDTLHAAMRPQVSGFAYQNYIDAGLTNWQQAYYGANLGRLISVKSAVDPTGVLRFRQGIPTR